ncbi:MAG: VOC family protein [Gemmatimonadales bacterium]
MTAGIRNPGDFCWINMLTPKPDEALEFYGALLGWTFGEIPGMGYSIKAGGKDVGGLFDLEGPNTPPGTPPLIGVMVKVESADAAAARVNALGGRAQPPFDIMEQGRMAVCFDPNGANLDVWEARKGQGMEADSEQHGTPSWFETLTTDTARATQFYAALFGWTAESKALAGTTYTVFSLGGRPIAGLMAIPPEMGPAPPHWGTYFTVREVEAAVRDAKPLGGTVCVPVRALEGIGRFAGIISPQGVMFYVIQYG